MTAVPDLVAFITARLDDDEQVASDLPGDGWPVHDNRVLRMRIPGGETSQGLYWPDRWNPVRVLDDIAVKRRILDLHGRMTITTGHPYFNDAHLTTEPMILCKSCEPESMWRREKSWPCRTLRLLALPYARHPDYRPEWTL